MIKLELDIIPESYWRIVKTMFLGILVGFVIQIWKTFQSVWKLLKTIGNLIILALVLMTFPLSIPTISLVVFVFKMGAVFHKSQQTTPGVNRMRRKNDTAGNYHD